MKDIARADIKPAFAVRNVPVALATDENYLSYLKVTINSAIASSPGSNLDIIVLHAGITEDAILDFTAGYASVGNASVRFVDISDELETSGLSDYRQTARLPLSSCYRLLLPRILPAYGKIVYIDVDVAVCRDLGELYATDVGDSYFAAAKDVVYNTKPEYVSWAGKWGFAEWDGYVNAGVLVMNLERFRREPVFDRLKEIVFEAAKWNCDQDALNFVCKGAIAPLDPRWNVQLGDYCYQKCAALKKITLAEGVGAIGQSCFANDGALEYIAIPDSLTTLGGYAFFRCASLSTIKMTDGASVKLSSIGEKAFKHCASLKTLTLPKAITTIPREMCNYCTTLEKVNARGAIKEIEQSAFSNCPALKEVTGLTAAELALVKSGRALKK